MMMMKYNDTLLENREFVTPNLRDLPSLKPTAWDYLFLALTIWIYLIPIKRQAPKTYRVLVK